MEAWAKPPESVVAYSAGIFDGEGSIFITEQNRGKGNQFRAFVCQSHKNRGQLLCEWLRSQWKIGKVRQRFTQFRKGYEPCRMWTWDIDRINEFRFFLESVLPYLRIRSDKAREALEYIQKRTSGRSAGKWTERELQYLRTNWQRLSDQRIGEILRRDEFGVSWKRKQLGFMRPKGPKTKVD